jgi:hypothetical protein
VFVFITDCFGHHWDVRSGCPQARESKRAEPKASDALHAQALRSPYGVVYLAAKKYYFGVGGGTRQFKAVLEEDGEPDFPLLLSFCGERL